MRPFEQLRQILLKSLTVSTVTSRTHGGLSACPPSVRDVEVVYTHCTLMADLTEYF